MDGLQMATDFGFALEPLFAFEGRASSMGYFPAGRHHFEIKAEREVGRTPFSPATVRSELER